MSEVYNHGAQSRSRYRRLAASMLLVLILAGAQPLVWRLVKRQAQVVHSRRTLQQQQADVRSRAEAMQNSLAQNADTIVIISAAAPPITSLSQAVERVELLADKRSLSLDVLNIAQRPDSAVETVIPVAISLRVFGPIETILEFMEQIEQLQELTMLESWQLEPAAAPPGVVGAQTSGNYRLDAVVLFIFTQP